MPSKGVRFFAIMINMSETKSKKTKKRSVAMENDARKGILEDLFYDFSRSKAKVYHINFVRGIFFGLGSVLGGTIVVAVVIWLLGQFSDIFPPIADFINRLIDTMQARGE